MVLSHRWTILAGVVLMLSLAGCTAPKGDEDPQTHTTIIPVKGCYRGFPYWNVSVAGCPSSVGTWDFRAGGHQDLDLRRSSTGFGLSVVASASPSTAEIVLEFENHTFTLKLYGSMGVYEDFEPLTHANTTVRGHDHYIVGSVCNVTKARLSVEVAPVAYDHLEIEYIEYGLVDDALSVAPGVATCNGRWTAEDYRIPPAGEPLLTPHV